MRRATQHILFGTFLALLAVGTLATRAPAQPPSPSWYRPMEIGADPYDYRFAFYHAPNLYGPYVQGTAALTLPYGAPYNPYLYVNGSVPLLAQPAVMYPNYGTYSYQATPAYRNFYTLPAAYYQFQYTRPR